jgi:hypothetical protein
MIYWGIYLPISVLENDYSKLFHKKKSLCKNYLKVFEKFDSKKNDNLNEISELINKQ